MITITEKAVKYVKAISESEGIGHCVVRLKCMGGGCSGFVSDLAFDSQINELDEICELDGVQVICDPMSFQYMDGATIDYSDGLMGRGFVVNNPRVKATCGCGNSFDI